MTQSRLKSEIWVQAHLRRCMTEGVYALVARKGDVDAGAIAVKVYMGSGLAKLFVRSRDLDGEEVWRNPLTKEDEADAASPEPDIDKWLAREASIDPDIWVIEIDDAAGRAFLD